MKKLIFHVLLNFSFLTLHSFCFSQNVKIDSLLTVLKTTTQDTTKVNIYNNLFLEYEYTDAERAKECLNKALEFAQKTGYKKGLAVTYIYLGYFAEDKGNYPGALENYFAALNVEKEMDNKEGLACSYNNIGNVYNHQGNYPEALKNYLSSLKIYEAIGDKRGIASSYGNIGNVYYDQANYPEALKNFSTSLKIVETTGDKRSISTSYNNIGNIYFDQGNYAEALKNHFMALKINETTGDKEGSAYSYNNIGFIYYSRGNYAEALKNYFTTLKIRDEIGDKEGIAGVYNNIGNVYIKQKKYKEAEEYLIKAKELSKEIGRKEYLRDAFIGLTELDSAKKNFKGAYENHKLYILYRDSLDNEETRKKTVQTQMTYDFEKKEAATQAEQDKRDIETQLELQKKNQVIYILTGTGLILILIVGLIFSFYRQNKLQAKQQNMELQHKLLRTQMNPHFLFNSLMSIQSFIYENEPKEAGMFLSRFAKLMRLILESSDLEYISLQKELATLENYLELQKLRFENKFDYTIELSPELDKENTAIPPMLTQPFIENALEHGLRYLDTKGFIRVLFGFTKEYITIEVEDNGIGREKAAELKKESEMEHQSMAMEISKERLFILNRGHRKKITLEVIDLKDDANNPKGTRVVFTIPFKEIDA